MSIQISKEPNENKLCVYQNHNKKIGELEISDFGTAFNWNGEDVIDFFLDVLTDCNFHSERTAIERALEIKSRLDYLRDELRKESMSYEELVELQSLSPYIMPDDIELLQAAGVEENNN